MSWLWLLLNGSLTGHSQNPREVAVAVDVAKKLNDQKKRFRIITPYDPQRSLLENALKREGLPWEDKCFNIDAFQGDWLMAACWHGWPCNAVLIRKRRWLYRHLPCSFRESRFFERIEADKCHAEPMQEGDDYLRQPPLRWRKGKVIAGGETRQIVGRENVGRCAPCFVWRVPTVCMSSKLSIPSARSTCCYLWQYKLWPVTEWQITQSLLDLDRWNA